MSTQDNRPGKPVKSSPSAQQPARGQFFKARPALVFDDDLTTTEKLAIIAIGLYDWGDGRGGYPCNATLIRACGLRTDGKDKGQRCIRALLSGLARRGYIRVETFKPTRENPTGRVIFLTAKAVGEQATPGHTSPGVEARPPDIQVRAPRTYESGPPPDIQVRRIDPSLSLTDPGIDQRGAGQGKPSNDDDKRPMASPAIDPKTAALQQMLDQKRATLAREREREADRQPKPMTAAIDRAMVDVQQVASMAGEPINAGPGDLARFASPGHREFREALDDDRRARFDALGPGKRSLILAPHARGFDPALMPMAVREIDSARAPADVAIGTAIETIEGLVRRVASGDAGAIATLAEALCQDFGTAEDRKRWGALHALAGQIHQGGVSADAVLDSLRQSRNPECERPGAVFTKALKMHGWQPN